LILKENGTALRIHKINWSAVLVATTLVPLATRQSAELIFNEVFDRGSDISRVTEHLNPGVHKFFLSAHTHAAGDHVRYTMLHHFANGLAAAPAVLGGVLSYFSFLNFISVYFDDAKIFTLPEMCGYIAVESPVVIGGNPYFHLILPLV